MSAPTPRRFSGGPPVVRLEPKTLPRSLGYPAELIAALDKRSKGRCDCCGERIQGKPHRHHRRLRSQGGRDEVENLLTLIFSHHNTIHQNPQWSIERGLIVPSWAEPAETPVLFRGTRRVLLLPNGDVREIA